MSRPIDMSANLKIPSGFDDASNDERIDFVQELWDRIAQSPADVPIPNEHKRVLDERLDAYAAEPRPGRTWPVSTMRVPPMPRSPTCYAAIRVDRGSSSSATS